MKLHKISYQKAIREAFEEELASNPLRVVMGEDITDGKKQSTLVGLDKRFPGRIITHLPLIEDMLGGIGLGMASGGLSPVIQFNTSTFLLLDFFEIYRLGNWRYRMAEKEGPGIVVRVAHAGYGGSGAEFSASSLASLFHLPNLWIAVPSTPYYAKGLLKTAFRANRPVIFLEHKDCYEREANVPEGEYTLPFGSADLFRKGKDISIICWSFVAYLAVDAARRLEKENIDCEVVSLQTLYPFDRDAILRSAEKTRRVLIAEEDILRGGIGAEISAEIYEALPLCRIKRLAGKNTPLPIRGMYGYDKFILPTVDSIMIAAKELYHA